jgi:hypothetical protein
VGEAPDDFHILRSVPLESIDAFAAFDAVTGEPALGLAVKLAAGVTWPDDDSMIIGVLRSDLAEFLRSLREAVEAVHDAVTDGQ